MVAVADIDLIEESLLLGELRRRCLRDYIEACYPSFELSPWQVRLCERLQAWVEAIERGESPRLMVFVPPQFGKSTIVSRAFPAWIAGRHPEWPGILASYAASLAAGHGRWIRNQIRTEIHQETFPGMRLADDSQAKDSMTLIGAEGTADGQILARGVGGGTTGNPAMWMIVDDPFADRQQADSQVVRDTVDDWYTSVATTRLGPGAGVLVMNTRWNIDDLCGRLIKRAKDGKGDPHVDQWEVISYPAEWMPGAPREFYTWEQTKTGETGWLTGRFRPADIKRKKANLPPRDWLSLFQQTPVLEGGGIIKTSWIIEEPWPVGWQPVVWQAWDLAGTAQDAKDGGCYSVGVAITMDWMRRWWLVDVVRGKWDSGELCEQILTFGRKWKANAVWGEDPVALYLLPFLRNRMKDSGKHIPFSRCSVQGRGDKVARAQASLVPVMSNGSFYVPKGAAWLTDLKTEMGQFPQGYKDQIDALSMAFAEAMPRAIPSPPPPTSKPKDPGSIRWSDLSDLTETPRKRSPWNR
jgi:predicted phage terminase large subunit-like protein